MGDVDRRTLLKWLGAGAAGLGATGVGGGVLGGTAGAAEASSGSPAAEVLRTRLTEAYGITYPIVQAGMAFYATPALAAAVTNAGGLGVLGPVPEQPPGLRAQIASDPAALMKRLGVALDPVAGQGCCGAPDGCPRAPSGVSIRSRK